MNKKEILDNIKSNKNILDNLLKIVNDGSKLPLHCCIIENEKWLNDLTEENEILKDRVKHLELFNRTIFDKGSDWVDSKLTGTNVEIGNIGKAFFEAHNHKTVKTDEGNFVTYYTK